MNACENRAAISKAREAPFWASTAPAASTAAVVEDSPLLLFKLGERQCNSSAFFTAGPSLAVNIQATCVDDGVREDIGDDIEKVDFGLNLGIGLELARFVLEGRSNWGMRSAFKVDAEPTT